MNKIFKVIWSRTKNCYVTASELAKGHTKSASTGSKARRKLLTSAAALAMVLTFAGGGNAWASVTVNTTDPGTPATVYTTKEVDNALGEKANSTDVASTYATKTEVADTYATKTALTEGLAEKANSDDVANTYATKSELESGLDGKLDVSEDGDVSVSGDLDVTGAISGDSLDVDDGAISGGSLDVGDGTITGGTITGTSVSAGEGEISGGSLDVDTGSIGTVNIADNGDVTGVKDLTATGTLTGTSGVKDGTLTDGTYVLKESTVGENLNALDTQVDANADAITTETSARKTADTALVGAVNGGIVVGADNVLMKNTTTIEDGVVSNTQSAVDTLIINQGAANQITLSQNGIKVGTNSSLMDENGVYTGGDNYTDAKAALNADGSIKGANGAFTVDTTGKVTAASGEIGGVKVDTDGDVTDVKDLTATGTITGGAVTDGVATLSGGDLTTTGDINAHDITSTGDLSTNNITATGITATSLNTQGGDISGGAITGTSVNVGSGSVSAGTGTFTGNVSADSMNVTNKVSAGSLETSGNATIGGTLTSNGITNTGSTTTTTLTVTNDASVGGDLAVTGDISGSSLDVGSGTIETTGAVEAGTLKTTGDASIGGNLTVEEDLTVDGKFNANTITSKLGLNNYTEIQGGNVTSVNSKLSIDDGITYTSTSTLTERGKTETAANGTTRNVDKMDAAESSNVITNDSIGQTSTFRQRVDEILNQLNTSETTFSRVDQQVDTITNEVQDGENSTSTTQTAENITNTAEQGTITNNANALVNTASDTISNEAVNDITTTSTAGNISNTAENGTISNTAQNITNKASENMTNTIGGNQTTTVTGDSSLTAGNIINEAKNKITNNAVDVETTASSSIVSKVSNDYGSNTSTQLSSQTEETMSQSDGKTASYLRGAAEEKSLLTDGSTKTTIDTIAGQTNTNITDGSNISNNLQKADQLASSVTDGTNTTVANQDAQSLASSITDGTKFNNTNSTVDKSEQLIKSSDTQYNASVKTATTTTERMVSGSIIDILKDADNGYINTTVTQGDNSTGVKRTSQDITQTAKQGTITNDAKNLVNTAEESMTNTAGTQIQDVVGNTTVTTTTEGTTFENADHNAAIGEGSITKTTISGNTLETGKATMDYAEVTKDLTVGGTTTTKDLHVTNNASVDGTLDVGGAANFQDSVTIAKDLSAGGNASIAGSVTAASYKVGNKTYIDDNGIHANNQKITNVAPGELSADSLDAVNGAQLYETNQRVASMDSRINEVGANAAAMANLHPLEFDADSKLNVAAAVGNYKNKTATALGLFYRPNEDVMFNVSGTVGSSDNMVGGGVAIRIGHGGNKARNKQMAENAAYVKGLESRVDKLQQQMDALLSVLNPNLSKDFPDVPENHWAYEAVSRLAGNGIIQGYEDGKYHGERTMTRYEMAEIIYKALSKGAEAEAELVEEFRPELQAMAAQNKA
mgnify:CR=1 FL=1